MFSGMGNMQCGCGCVRNFVCELQYDSGELDSPDRADRPSEWRGQHACRWHARVGACPVWPTLGAVPGNRHEAQPVLRLWCSCVCVHWYPLPLRLYAPRVKVDLRAVLQTCIGHIVPDLPERKHFPLRASNDAHLWGCPHLHMYSVVQPRCTTVNLWSSADVCP